MALGSVFEIEIIICDQGGLGLSQGLDILNDRGTYRSNKQLLPELMGNGIPQDTFA